MSYKKGLKEDSDIDRNDLRITMIAGLFLLMFLMLSPVIMNLSSLIYAGIVAILFFDNSFRDLAYKAYMNRDKFNR